ncbi:MAG: Ig-like domain-containing protein, partial [Nocardioidaceae bacterium]
PVPNGAGWNSSAPTLTLTATDAGTGVASITYKVGAAAPVTVNAASTSFTVSAAGSTTVTYSATDVAGNGESAKTYTVKLDSSAPATTLASSPVPNGAGWNSSAPTLTLTATDAGSGVASITYKIGAAAPVTVVGASTSFAVSAQGSTTVTYAATDAAGNVETTKTYTVKLDTLAPAAPTGVAISADTGSSSTDGVTKTAVQTLSGTAEANSTVELKLGAVVQGTTTASGTGAFAFSLGTLAEGSYGYTVTAIDAAGNRSTGTSYTVRVDTRAAVLSGVFPVNGGIYSNGQFKNGCATQDSVCGTVTDPAYTAGLGTVNLKLTNSAGNCLSAGGTFTSAACSTPLVPTGTTSWNHVVGTLATGSYTLTVTVTDLAGNILVGTYAFIRS